jgi:hypothetical protein
LQAVDDHDGTQYTLPRCHATSCTSGEDLAFWSCHRSAWHHEGVPSEMPEVLEAHAAYKKADEDALAMRARARARLGLAVEKEYDGGKGSTLEAIAKKLGVVAEQVRRYRQAYRDWLRDHDQQQP